MVGIIERRAVFSQHISHQVSVSEPGAARLVDHQVGRGRLLGGEDVRALRSGCTAMSSGADATDGRKRLD